MAKKIRYYYDTETCSFEKEKVTARSILSRVLFDGGIAAILACFLFAGYYFFYDDPKYAYLKEQNTSLSQKVSDYQNLYASLEETVNTLHEKDNDFYRSILDADPITNGIWEGGHGGAAEVVDVSQPEVLKKTEEKLDILNYKVNLQDKSYEFLFKKLMEKEEELKHIPAIKPVAGGVISGFGVRLHPIHKIKKMHTGLDFQANTGTPVIATGDGVIEFAGVLSNGYGIHVDIDHGFGYITKYGHLSRLNVKEGQKVKRGDVVGWSGNTGLSKGPHLHYEILKNGDKIDPIDYFYGDLSPAEYIQLRKEAETFNESMD